MAPRPMVRKVRVTVRSTRVEFHGAFIPWNADTTSDGLSPLRAPSHLFQRLSADSGRKSVPSCARVHIWHSTSVS